MSTAVDASGATGDELVEQLLHLPRTRRGQLTQAAILSAATRLFRAKGFHATSINDIGGLAGVSGPAMYAHFDSKETLLATLIYRSMAATAELQREVLNQRLEPAVALDRLVRLWAQHYVDHRDVQAVAFQEIAHLGERFRALILRQRRHIVAEWISLLPQIPDVRPGLSEEEARLRVVAVEGLMNILLATTTPLEGDALVDLLHRLALSVLLSPAPGGTS